MPSESDMPSPRFEPVIGRYLEVPLLGESHRVYVEQAGEGLPLVCLHTAGSDSRQYRGVMNDSWVTRNFRVICFDLPWHGKTSPPEGWHDREYQLSAQNYEDIILQMCDVLELESPVLMGCSIGGRMTLRLALTHPERFTALIALQAGARLEPYYDKSYLHRPDVHGGEVCAAVVSGLVGPAASDRERWETLWHYMQGGPGVFKGDLYFYNHDPHGDLWEQIQQVDRLRRPLYLLTGEYDYSCTPADTKAVADSLPDAELVIMEGLGHFPMSEDPDLFGTYLRPVLQRILTESRVDATPGKASEG